MAQRTPVPEIDATEAMRMLSSRWEQRRSVREAFLSVDKDCDGVISPAELRASVDNMGVKLSGPEFRKLWRMLDGAGEGRLTHAAFNRVVGPLIFPSSWGFSATMNRPVTPPLSPSGEALLGQSLRRKVQDPEAVWRELDMYASGSIRHSEFIQGLRMLGIRMADSTIAALMKRFADPRNTSGDMNKAEFLACMAYLRDQVPEPASPRDAEAHAALLLAAEHEVARVLPFKAKERMVGALAPFNTAGTGTLSYADFGAMLAELGAALSPAQVDALCEKYDDLGEGTLDLRNFAGVFIAAHSGAEGALTAVGASEGAGGVGGSSFGHSSRALREAVDADLEDDGGLGLGGPHAQALIARNTTGTYPSLLSSRKGYPPWAEVGVRPLVDPLTMQPLTMEKMARLAMSRTGLSEGETRAVLCLVGRRAPVTAALQRLDKGSGAVPKHVFRDTLAQAFDCTVDASTADLLAYRYDPEHKGRVIYFLDFFSSMSRLLDAPYHPTQAPLALAQIGLEIIPGRTLERPAGAAGAAAPGTPSSSSSSSSSSKALSPLQLAMAGSPLAGMAGGGGQGQGQTQGLPAPDPFSAHWREKEASPRRGGAVVSGSGSGSSRGSAREAATGAFPLSSIPKVVTHSSDSGAPYISSSHSNSSSRSAYGSADDSDATEAVLGRLRSALAQKWSGVAHGCASSLEAATSPLVQAGRSGVSADLGSPLRLNLGGASGGGRRDSSSSAGAGAGAAAVSPLDRTLRLGAAARAAGGGGSGSGSVSGGRGAAPSLGSTIGRTTLPLSRVPLSLLQRVLAQQGVGVTPRELRLLSARYGNAGREGSEPLHVNLEELIRESQ